MILVTQSEVEELCACYGLEFTNNKPFNSICGWAVPNDKDFYLVSEHQALKNKEEVVCLEKTYNNCYRVVSLFDHFESEDEWHRETRTLGPSERNIFKQTLFSYTELKLRLNRLCGEMNDYVRDNITNTNLDEINKDFE